MVSSLFYYQLALVAIIWLFVMLHLSWPKQSAAPPTAPATPIKPKSKRSTEPKAFEACRTSLTARCVSKRPCIRLPRLRDGPILCRPQTVAPGRWIRPCTSVPIWAVTTAAGRG